MNDNDSKSLFKETQNRIRTLALVHEKLYKSEDVEYVNLKEYLTSIVSLLSYSFDKEYIDVNYNFESDEIEKFDIEKAMPCGLITNEILSNAYKYAFPKKITGEINIELKKEATQFILIIEDDGVGIPKDIDVNNSNTLGLELINSLVMQLEGDLKIDSSKGTRYHITFPV